MPPARRTTLTAMSLVVAAVFAAGCSDNGTNPPPPPPPPAPGVADITTDITADRTLFADTTYTLKGFIHVTNGATLTIQPGTKILGDFNTLGSSLFIMRGAKIMAEGTVDKPIVFTSSQPVGQRQPGDWGGLIIIGNGIDNRSGTLNVEGTGTDGATVAGGKNYTIAYSGGADNTDNSGVLQFVRVEFAGFGPEKDAELNAFTFAAVGSGTTLSHLEAMAGLDDGYEWWGGDVDADHLISYEVGDDHFDQSEGYNGRIQFAIGFQSDVLTPRTGAGSVASDPEGIENDGCAGTGCTNGFDTAPHTIPMIANFTLIGTGDINKAGTSGGIGMMIRRGVGGYYVNGIVARWPRAAISLRDQETFDRAGDATTPDLATTELAILNVVLADNGAVFQDSTSATSPPQRTFDLAANGLVAPASTTSDLFATFPATPAAASDFDWTPAAGSDAATGGMVTFTGAVATKAGAKITGTSYAGAADPAGTDKWWLGWTNYARN